MPRVSYEQALGYGPFGPRPGHVPFGRADIAGRAGQRKCRRARADGARSRSPDQVPSSDSDVNSGLCSRSRASAAVQLKSRAPLACAGVRVHVLREPRMRPPQRARGAQLVGALGLAAAPKAALQQPVGVEPGRAAPVAVRVEGRSVQVVARARAARSYRARSAAPVIVRSSASTMCRGRPSVIRGSSPAALRTRSSSPECGEAGRRAGPGRGTWPASGVPQPLHQRRCQRRRRAPGGGPGRAEFAGDGGEGVLGGDEQGVEGRGPRPRSGRGCPPSSPSPLRASR